MFKFFIVAFLGLISSAQCHIALRVEKAGVQKWVRSNLLYQGNLNFESQLDEKHSVFSTAHGMLRAEYGEATGLSLSSLLGDAGSTPEVVTDSDCCVLKNGHSCQNKRFLRILHGSSWQARFTSYPSQGLNFLGLYLPLLSKGSILQLLFKDRLVGSIDLSHHAFYFFKNRDIEEYHMAKSKECDVPKLPSVFVGVFCAGCVFDTYKLVKLPRDVEASCPTCHSFDSDNHVVGYFEDDGSLNFGPGRGSDSGSLILTPLDLNPDATTCSLQVAVQSRYVEMDCEKQWKAQLPRSGYYLTSSLGGTNYFYRNLTVGRSPHEGVDSAVASVTRPYSVVVTKNGDPFNSFSHISRAFRSSTVVVLLKKGKLQGVIRYNQFFDQLLHFFENNPHRRHAGVTINFLSTDCSFDEMRVHQELDDAFYSHDHVFGVCSHNAALRPLISVQGTNVQIKEEPTYKPFYENPRNLKIAGAGAGLAILLVGCLLGQCCGKHAYSRSETEESNIVYDVVNFDHEDAPIKYHQPSGAS